MKFKSEEEKREFIQQIEFEELDGNFDYAAAHGYGWREELENAEIDEDMIGPSF